MYDSKTRIKQTQKYLFNIFPCKQAIIERNKLPRTLFNATKAASYLEGAR